MDEKAPAPATGGVAINAGGDVTILGDVVGGDKIVIHNPAPLPPREIENRRGLGLLWRSVKAFWIEGVLREAVHQAAPLPLGKEARPEAIHHPWESVLESAAGPRQVLAPEANLAEHFEQTGRALLILGEPGAGKTITLLELARDLLARVGAGPEADFNHPVPVVFNLASWTERLPLLEWLTAELAAKYHVPQRIGRPWLLQHRVLPLLDGLDEVAAEHRAACVRAINHFAQTVGFAGLAVCCRLAEYTALPERLHLQAALVLQPLQPEQVTRYLASAPEAADHLAAAMREDPALLKLAETPLVLSLMRTVYAEAPPAAAPATGTLEERRARLFEAYVARMFKRRGGAAQSFTPAQTRRWLGWLARKMLDQGQSIFLIEQLQPAWLSRLGDRLAYAALTRLITGGLAGLILLITVSLAVTDSADAGRNWAVVAPLTLLTCGLAGLALMVVEAELMERRLNPPRPSRWRAALYGLGLGLLFTGVFGAHGLALGVLAPRALPAEVASLPEDFRPLLAGLMAIFLAFAFGVLGGGTFGVLFGARAARLGRRYDIRVAEALSWDWRRAGLGIGLGLAGGLTASLLFAVLAGLVAFVGLLPAGQLADLVAITLRLLGTMAIAVLFISLGFGPLFGALGAVGGGLFAGLRRRVVDRGLRPNLGLQVLRKRPDGFHDIAGSTCGH